MNEKVAVAALRQVKEVLDEHGIEFWLDFGTLLGAIRDGKFIPWDGDIDLGTWSDQNPKITMAFQELRDKEFEVRMDGAFARKKDCLINLAFYHIENNKAILTWCKHPKLVGQILAYLHMIFIEDYPFLFRKSRVLRIITENICQIVHILPLSLRRQIAKIIKKMDEEIGCKQIRLTVPIHHFMNLNIINFYGMEFKVPALVEKYLEYKYGKKWRVPKKDYIFCEEDGAIVTG